jgi:aminoglycoside phosphotransferase (APT) family kinase protein
MEEAPYAEQQQLKSLFMKYFAKLHQLDWQAIVPNPSQYEFNSQYEYIEKPLHSMRQVIIQNKLAEFMEVAEWLEERIATVPNEQLSLVHYDYHLGNIVLSEEKKPFVIDWTVSRVTDYRIDLGWTLLLESTYEAYENRDILLNYYQAFRTSRVSNIEFFEVVAALRRLVVMAISFSGKDDVVATRPEVAEIMKGYTNHVNGVLRILKDRSGITLHEFEAMISKASTDFKTDIQ